MKRRSLNRRLRARRGSGFLVSAPARLGTGPQVVNIAVDERRRPQQHFLDRFLEEHADQTSTQIQHGRDRHQGPVLIEARHPNVAKEIGDVRGAVALPPKFDGSGLAIGRHNPPQLGGESRRYPASSGHELDQRPVLPTRQHLDVTGARQHVIEGVRGSQRLPDFGGRRAQQAIGDPAEVVASASVYCEGPFYQLPRLEGRALLRVQRRPDSWRHHGES